jgi:hypothetical protein
MQWSTVRCCCVSCVLTCIGLLSCCLLLLLLLGWLLHGGGGCCCGCRGTPRRGAVAAMRCCSAQGREESGVHSDRCVSTSDVVQGGDDGGREIECQQATARDTKRQQLALILASTLLWLRSGRNTSVGKKRADVLVTNTLHTMCSLGCSPA